MLIVGALTSCEVVATWVPIRTTDNVQAVVASHPPGTTFVFESGVHNGVFIVPREGDTFYGHPDGSSILNGGGVTASAPAFRSQQSAGAPRIHDVTIKDLTFENYAPTFYNGIVDASSEVYDASQDSDVYVPAADWAPSTNWTMTNLVFRNNIGDRDSPALLVGSGSVVDGVTITHNNGPGIFGHGRDIRIQNSTITDNSLLADGQGFYHAGGIKLVTVHDTVIANNTVSNNEGPGVWIDIDGDNVEITGNTIENNGFSGIYYEISRRATITNNIVNNNGYSDTRYWLFLGGIAISTSNENTITGNQLSGNAGGITVFDQRTLRQVDAKFRPSFGRLYEADGVTDLEWRAEDNTITGNHTEADEADFPTEFLEERARRGKSGWQSITGVSAAEAESVGSTVYQTSVYQGNTYGGDGLVFSWLYGESGPGLNDQRGSHQTLEQWRNDHGNDVITSGSAMTTTPDTTTTTTSPVDTSATQPDSTTTNPPATSTSTTTEATTTTTINQSDDEATTSTSTDQSDDEPSTSTTAVPTTPTSTDDQSDDESTTTADSTIDEPSSDDSATDASTNDPGTADSTIGEPSSHNEAAT